MQASAGHETGGIATQRLARLMGARLALSLLCFGLSLALDGVEREFSAAEKRGFYATVAFAFLSTAIYGAFIRRIRRPDRFAALQVATDLLIVTALVYFSGGAHSIFIFLYALVTVYGAVFLGQRGALATALACAGLYGSVIAAEGLGWMEAHATATRGPLPILLATWGVHASALVLVAALASVLSRELKQTGEALNQRTRDLKRLRRLHERTVESLMSGLLTTDSEGRITSFNPEAERITGAVAAEVVGHDVEAVIPGVCAVAMSASPGGAPTRMRARIPHRNRWGNELHLGVAGSILREADGSPAGHVLIFQELTKVVEMERELRRSERLAAVGQLAASIAHEIRNPLAAISGSIQVLRANAAGARDGPERVKLMEIVIRETDRLNGLITDFLGYARSSPLRRAPVEVSSAIEEVLKIFEAVRADYVKRYLRLEPNLYTDADALQLRQLLWNLVLNAVQAMQGGGRLSILTRAVADDASQEVDSARRNAVEEGADRIEIVVTDTGVGIPPEVMDQIFDPFFTTKSEGSGLGLATLHRIVEDHDGTVRVESEPGAGTVFRIRLPRAEKPE